MKFLIRTAPLVALLSTGSFAVAADREAKSDTTVETETTKTTKTKGKRVKVDTKKPVDADNTGTNKRDRADNEPTADQQKNNKTDLDLTAEIRRAIMKDKGLSMNAHNVKIIAMDGKVTLKGPVETDAEKQTVEQKAFDVAGRARVTSEIEIKK